MDDEESDASRFIEPTTHYWQNFTTPDAAPRAPYRFGYPVALRDGRILVLPIRRRTGAPDRAAASLIPNQASFAVVDALAWEMAELAGPLGADIVIAMPTLGLALAPGVARGLGHRNYAPLGYSRKYWYDERLSAPISSATSPDPGKMLYLDPNLRPRIAGARAIIVDDTISSGQTALVASALVEQAGARIVGLVFAMGQSTRWRAMLRAARPDLADVVHCVFHTPLLKWAGDGWIADLTEPAA